MASLNRIVLIGRIASDIELRYTPSNIAVASFRLAVDRPYGGQGQEKKTDFFACKAWRQKADFVSKYAGKGRMVAVEGRVEINDYVGQDGQKKYFTEVIVDNVEILDSSRDRQGGGDYQPEPEPAPRPAQQPAQRQGAPRQRQAAAPATGYGASARPIAPGPGQLPYPPDDDFDDSDPFADE